MVYLEEPLDGLFRTTGCINRGCTYMCCAMLFIITAGLFQLAGSCVEKCPTGYTVDDTGVQCVKCRGGLCPIGMYVCMYVCMYMSVDSMKYKHLSNLLSAC